LGTFFSSIVLEQYDYIFKKYKKVYHHIGLALTE